MPILLFSKKYRRFFPHVNKVVRILTLSDILILSGFGLLSPIFAVFLTEQIQGGNLEVVGFASTIYFLTKSLLQIPVAEYLDQKRGEKDDFCAMLFGSIIISLVPLFYLFAKTPFHIYLAQIFYGIGSALSFPSWMAIFTRHIDKSAECFEWSIYYTATDLGGALTAALGGILAQNLGFRPLFFIVFAFSSLGSLLLIEIYLRMIKGT
ncbi:MAG: MFS transporter [Candidatus Cloacimonetes bacterium]|nr:MFS transporter [Candidatus Cloacimonadota bacterium]